jgi:N-acetylneuraminate epimerase
MKTLILMLAAMLGSGYAAREWSRLAPIPDPAGVAAPFAGLSGEALIVAGGANFPDKSLWDGGRKVWHDAIFALERPDGEWKRAGTLPRPIAYGVSVTHRGGVVCVGGSDATHCYADAFRLEWRAGQVAIMPLPPLSTPLANACGALIGDVLYVAGGQQTPNATRAVSTAFRIDLSASKPAWQEIDPYPDAARILAVAAAYDGAFWLIGGAELTPGESRSVVRRYLRDVYRYRPGVGWQRMPDLPDPIAAAPSPAPCDESGLYILGGDDGSHVSLKPGPRLPGFSRTILRFDGKQGTWQQRGQTPAPRVTAPCVHWGKSWIIPSGEGRPGVRSPQVWAWTPDEQE